MKPIKRAGFSARIFLVLFGLLMLVGLISVYFFEAPLSSFFLGHVTLYQSLEDGTQDKDPVEVITWSKSQAPDEWRLMGWNLWYWRLQGLESQSQEVYEQLQKWHYLALEFPWKRVNLTVRYEGDTNLYFLSDGDKVYEVPGDALWFNRYLSGPEVTVLYRSAAPPQLSIHHNGPKGQLRWLLKASHLDWFYKDARGLSQSYTLQENDLGSAQATSETLLIQSLEEDLPQVKLLEADALQIVGLSSHAQVEIEAFATENKNESLGPVAFEMASGHLTPLMRSGTTRYRVTVNYPSVEDVVGEGFGTCVYEFLVHLELNPLVFGHLEPLPAGGLFTIVVENVPEAAVPILQQNIVNKTQFSPLETRGGAKGRYIAFLPLSYTAAEGSYPYKITLSFSGGEKSSWSHEGTLEVLPRQFKTQQLTVDPNVEATTRSDEAYAQYSKYFLPARDQSIPTPLWDGPFIPPINGRLTTEWGMRRSVNGALTTYRHNGVDLAAPRGTPVQASNRGRVIFAMDLILTGNSVIIDHGLGLFTVYLHLDRMDVVPEQMVEKGEMIGAVGSTGFSTGPHLHFTFSHYRTALDPFMIYNWSGQYNFEIE